MTGNEQREDLSRHWLIDHAVAINDAVQKHLRLVQASAIAGVARDAEEDAEAEIAKAPLIRRVEYYLFLVALFAIYVIDLLLFGVAAEYLAARVGGAHGTAAHLARYVMPAVFLAVELEFGIKMERARRESRHFFGSAFARRAWTGFSIALALAIPLVAVAIAKSANDAGDSMSVYLIIFLGLLSFVCHVSVIFGGRLTIEAKAYVIYAVSRFARDKRADLAERRAKQSRTLANGMFMNYVHALREHNARYKPVPSGPFDTEVVDYLRREFPHVALRTAGSFPEEPEAA